MARSFHKNKKPRDRFTVEIESLDQDGRGVAHREGKAVFVEGALPHEVVTYERIRNKTSFGKTKPENILPPIYGPFWGYRHRARFTVRDVTKKGGVLVGFHERSSSYVADMHSCAILPKHVSDMIDPLRELVSTLTIRQRLPQIDVAVDGHGRTALVFRNLEPLGEGDEEKLLAFGDQYGADIWLQPKGPDSAAPIRPELENALGLYLSEFDVRIAFKPTDFTQVNHALNETMVSRAVRLLRLTPESRVVDFFCGLGNFTLPLARRSARVIGLEGSEGLVSRAKAGAAENGLADKTDFVARNLFTWSEQDWDAIWKKMGGIDRLLLDPPREGAQAVCQVLAATDKRPERVVYVSCNPATLARDCAILQHQGGWRLLEAGVMNMFPHTGHVESMAVLVPGPKPLPSEKAEDKAESGDSRPAEAA